MTFDEEQIEILGVIENALKNCVGREWGRYKGDVTCRVIAHYISKHLPEAYKIAGPNVYIEGNSSEFDLLIVDSNNQTLGLTSAYPANNVYRVIEVKKYGIIEKWATIDQKLQRLRDSLLSATKGHGWMGAFYISIRETINPVKPTSHRYAERTRHILEQGPSPVGVYILQDTRQNIIQSGQWERFIKALVQGL